MRATFFGLFVAVSLGGCGDGGAAATLAAQGVGAEGADDNGVDSASQCPSDMVWNAALRSCQSACTLEWQVGRRTTGEKTVDCGTLPVTADVPTRQKAQQCVLDVVGKRPFKLIQWKQGKDSAVAVAYASPGGPPGLMFMLHYDGDISGGGGVGAVIHEQTCLALRARPDCELATESACLECADFVEASTACDERPRKADQPCRGLGNYQAGKEGSYQPCCAGLREVSQLVSGFGGDNNEPVCTQPAGHNQYACVEGRCGDGRCEAPEAVACGCPLDCPSAVWETGDAGMGSR